MNGKNSGWGLGCLVIFALIFGIGFLIDLVGQESQEKQTVQQLGEGIVEQSKAIQEQAKAIGTQAETIGEMGSEIVDASSETRMVNRMLIGLAILLVVVILVQGSRRGARREA